jgi:glycerol uptake facilitator-like aquaporin
VSAVSRRLVAEGVGTALLLAAIVGSGIMAERLAGGNVAIALLCNSLASGAMLYVLITILAPISGAHFNPAVTLAFLITGSIGGIAALAYMAFQVIGAVLGSRTSCLRCRYLSFPRPDEPRLIFGWRKPWRPLV